MTVYVAGKYGDTPLVVSQSLETAMKAVLEIYVSEESEPGRDEQWVYEFVDGHEDQLRCTVTVTDDDGEAHALYVARYDVE